MRLVYCFVGARLMSHPRIFAAFLFVTLAALAACGTEQPEPIPGKMPMPTKQNNTPTNASTGNSSTGNNKSGNNTTSTPGALVGDRCESDADCDFDHVCDILQQDGYCRPITCLLGCSGTGGACVELVDYGEQCWARCDQIEDAPRDGFRCETVGEFEVMIPEDASSEIHEHDALLTALDVICESSTSANGDREFTFTIGPEDNGFVMVPYSLGLLVRPVALVLPSGEEIDLVYDYRHHNARYSDGSLLIGGGIYGAVGFSWAIQVPYAPQFGDMLMEGEYTLRVAGEDDMCFYMASSRGKQTIDLNLYFTNVRGLSAVNAPFDEDFQKVLARFDEIYAQQGISIGKVRYLNVSREVTTEFAIIRNITNARKLMGWGRARSEELRDNLSVDIFMVDSIVIQGGTLLGLSGGVPGSAGLHGSASNGLIFNSSLIGVDNAMVAHIMAHEVGHYLGLRHTTEIINDLEFERLVGVTDPLEDTVECSSVSRLAFDCPDANNLMFPAAPQRANFLPEVTEGQKFVLERNPLTH